MPADLELTLRETGMDDPVLVPVLDELNRDYTARYPHFDVASEMAGYPVEEFRPPDGVVLVLEEAGQVVAAGAYRREDERTAELKRIWTSPAHRRRGLAARIVRSLEDRARAAGYERVHLTTGPRQPEARAMYLALGYTARGDHDEIVRTASAALAFDKDL